MRCAIGSIDLNAAIKTIAKRRRYPRSALQISNVHFCCRKCARASLTDSDNLAVNANASAGLERCKKSSRLTRMHSANRLVSRQAHVVLTRTENKLPLGRDAKEG